MERSCHRNSGCEIVSRNIILENRNASFLGAFYVKHEKWKILNL